MTRDGPWPFFAITLSWSWALFGLAAALPGGISSTPTLSAWALGGLGPLVAAIAVSAARGGRPAVRALAGRSLRLERITLRWWATIAVFAIAPALVGAGASGWQFEWRGPAVLSVIVGSVAFGLVAGLAEEPGWRGVALDDLGRRLPLVAAALVIGAVWALWHLPLFLIDGTFQHGLGVGGAGFWWFLAQLAPTALLLAWVVSRNSGLVAAAVALHALGNAAGEVLVQTQAARWASFVVLSVLALAVVMCDRPHCWTPHRTPSNRSVG